MKKLVYVILAAATLALACLIPVCADRMPTAYEYDKMRESVMFLGSYFLGQGRDDIGVMTLIKAEELYPESASYRDVGGGSRILDSVTLTEQMFKTAFYAYYPNAPVNFFDQHVKADFSPDYDSSIGKYVLKMPTGTIVIYPAAFEFAITLNGSVCDFWLVERERFYLPASEYPPEPYPSYFEYGGFVYYYGPSGYYRFGDPLTTGTRIGLEYAEDGVYLRYCDADMTLPAKVLTPPAPNGDVDGDGSVNARDVIMTMRAALGQMDAKGSFYNADICADGYVNARDVIEIMKRALASG